MDWYKNIISFFSSSRGRDVLLYLLFVAISAAFWAILTLGNSIKTHYKVKFTIEGIPQGTTLITDYPQYIDVSVKNNGYAITLIDDNFKTDELIEIALNEAPRLVLQLNNISDNILNIALNKDPNLIGLLQTKREIPENIQFLNCNNKLHIDNRINS